MQHMLQTMLLSMLLQSQCTKIVLQLISSDFLRYAHRCQQQLVRVRSLQGHALFCMDVRCCLGLCLTLLDVRRCLAAGPILAAGPNFAAGPSPAAGHTFAAYPTLAEGPAFAAVQAWQQV